MKWAILSILLLGFYPSVLAASVQYPGDRIRFRGDSAQPWTTARITAMDTAGMIVQRELLREAYPLRQLRDVEVWRATNPAPILVGTTTVGALVGVFLWSQDCSGSGAFQNCGNHTRHGQEPRGQHGHQCGARP